MLQYSQFRIHHSLDAKGINLLSTSNCNAAIRPWVCRFVIFQSEVIHVLKVIGTNDIAVYLVFLINKEYTCKNIVADYFG